MKKTKTILFGASKLGEIALNYLRDKCEIINFCDNDKKKWGKEFNGIKIISPDYLKEFDDVQVIITSQYREEISYQLIDMGIKNIKNFIINIDLKNDTSTVDQYSIESYSQEGEDLVLKEYFSNKQGGIYVDIGAHHPQRFSNTYFFYKNYSWHGINVEPSFGSKRIFDKARPRDINLEVGISNNDGEQEYYIFNNSALNGFNKKLSDERQKNTEYYIKEIRKVKVYTLKSILNKNLKNNTNIDFMDIDVEGYELEVLKSNDWQKYRPKILMVEQLKFDFCKLEDDCIYKYLKDVGYEICSKTKRTVFYQDVQNSKDI